MQQQQQQQPNWPNNCDQVASNQRNQAMCKPNVEACCNTRGTGPGEGPDCHFRQEIRDSPVRMNEMQRGNIQYHDLEKQGKKNKYGLNGNPTDNGQAETPARGRRPVERAKGIGPHNGGIFELNNRNQIMTNRYKPTNLLSPAGKQLITDIAVMRGKWLGKYYRTECYKCDGHCNNHYTRMQIAQNNADLEGAATGGKTRKSKRRNKKNILKSKRMRKTKRKTKRLRKTRKNKKSKKSRKSRRRR